MRGKNKRGRDSETGRFITIPEAKRRYKTATVDTIAVRRKKAR